MESLTTQERAVARMAAAKAAAALVSPGMVVGLGTGDTASQVIRYLAEACPVGVTYVPTSVKTAALAENLGLQLLSLNAWVERAGPDLGNQCIDITIDGADEVDPNLSLIKGMGGALLLEKMVAHASKKVVIVADEQKIVSALGLRCKVPVEVVLLGVQHTLHRLRELCVCATIRLQEGTPFLTDSGNLIIDVPIPVRFNQKLPEFHAELKQMVGVVETGLFLHEASVVIVGHRDGNVHVLHKRDL